MVFYEKKFINNEEKSFFGSFSVENTVVFNVQLPRKNGTTDVYMHLYGEGIENSLYKKIKLNWESTDNAIDIYSCSLDLKKIGVGLFYYKYEVISDKKIFLGDGKKISCLSEISDGTNGMIQLLVYENKTSCPNWMHGGVMYHIFVDRFNSSGKCKLKKNAILNEDWYNGIPQFADKPGGYVENNMFFGGDLYGIVEKLDYLKELGVSCLYLSPIFEAYSNHKYDTGNYMEVDSMFGSEEALDLLIIEAKKRDIHIIFDGVFNHTGADSIYFNKFGNYDSIGAYQSKDSKYYDWYNFRSFPNDYECWWDVKILPRVNSDNEGYKQFILGKNGVVEKWMKKGIDGFRLDVADELSDEFLKTLNKKVKEINPEGIIYGEVWEDASNKIAYDKRKKYFLGNELDSVMNYPLREAIISYVKNGDSEKLYQTCKMLNTHYPKYNADLLMNVLGTHDTERILTVLGGKDGSNCTNEELSKIQMTKSERETAVTLLKLAFTILATVPGIPCIYYGDEAGMEGYRDPFNRMPFPWGRENNDLISYYKKILQIRRGEEVYKQGLFKMIECTPDLLAYARFDENNFMITVINRSDEKYRLSTDADVRNAFTDRSIRVFNPKTAYILKCKSQNSYSTFNFYK